MPRFDAPRRPPPVSVRPTGSFGGRVLSRLGVKPAPVAAKPVAQPVQRRAAPSKKPAAPIVQPRPRPQTITTRTLERLGIKPKPLVPSSPPKPAAVKPVQDHNSQRLALILKLLNGPAKLDERTLSRIDMTAQAVDRLNSELQQVREMVGAMPGDAATLERLDTTAQSVSDLRADLERLSSTVGGLPEALKPPPAPKTGEDGYVPPDSRLDRVLLNIGKFDGRMDKLEQQMSRPREYELVRDSGGKITGSREVRSA